MVLRVVGGYAVRRDGHLVIPLIRVDGRGADTSVSIDASQDQGYRTQGVKDLVEFGAEEGAVAVLDEYPV